MVRIFSKKAEAIILAVTVLMVTVAASYPYFIGTASSNNPLAIALLITPVASCTSYFSFRYICGEWKFAVAGTFLFLLSQFYLADLVDKGDMSECVAFIFIPVLFAGLYDIVEYAGKKCWLAGVALLGFIASNVAMALLGILVTMGYFVVALVYKDSRKKMLNAEKRRNIIIVAVIVIIAAILVIVRAAGGALSEVQGGFIGEHTQSLASFFLVKGAFDEGACAVGIGTPILMLMCTGFLFREFRNKWGEIFFFVGILLFFTTTDLFPWGLFNGTFLNLIQYTYRLYPYALCVIILGILLMLSEKCTERVDRIVAFLSAVSLFFGIWQNMPK